MKKSEQFFNWIDDNQYHFKYDCHYELAKKFDPECNVNFLQSETDDWYSEKTNIIFSDGSCLTLNYKGESE